MDLSSGARLGPYEILSAVGAGGMGQVYKARDTRLDRIVAIKILPQTLATDPQFRDRFDREARVIAQLDHPNICALYDLGQHDGTAYLVLQFLEGETLAARLQLGPLPVPHAIQYGIQVADALAKAHRAGIVHRDLKPGNIMVTKSGAKLLDFGLAKSGAPIEVAAPRATALTAPQQVTAQGTILGTFQYMAPEQIEGAEADARSDIWAFGCVLYEMLTGAQPFQGKSAASLLANIMNTPPPPLGERGVSVAGPLEHVVGRCLEKNPEDRWQSAADIAHHLRWVATAPEGATVTATPRRWQQSLGYALVGGLAAAAAVGLMQLRPRPADPAASPFKLTLLPPADLSFTPFGSNGFPEFALSPDGERIAFVASPVGEPPSLWVRRLETGTAQQLPRSEDASAPFWFPDGQSLGFFADGRLKTIAIDGDRPTILGSVIDAAGGTSNGEIILVGQHSGPLLRIPSRGGQFTVVTTAKSAAGGDRWPQFLPDGRRFIYTQSRGSAMLASLDSTDSSELRSGRQTVVFDPSGWLLYAGASNKLSAQAVDPSSLSIIGQERDVLDGIAYAGGAGFPPVSVSSRGVLAYWDGTTVARQHAWFDRQGNQLTTLPLPPEMNKFAIAPDGKRLAFAHRAAIWVMDAAGASTRFSFGSAGDNWPAWSPDGSELWFVSRDGRAEKRAITLFRRASTGLAKEQVVASIPFNQGPQGPNFGDLYVTDWSRDARTVLLNGGQQDTSWDIYAMDVATGGLTSLRQTKALEIQGRFSPDGKWFAYASNETGRWEVFAEPYPPSAATGRSQVSTDGGSQPVWRRDGAELLFLAPDGKLMSAAIKTDSNFVAAPATALFQTTMRPTYAPYPVDYDVTSDGQRFLIEGVRASTGPTIGVVVNWSLGR